MKEMDEMEKANAELASAIETVSFEHRKKNEVQIIVISVFNL